MREERAGAAAIFMISVTHWPLSMSSLCAERRRDGFLCYMVKRTGRLREGGGGLRPIKCS
jgi:hypothetical protein